MRVVYRTISAPLLGEIVVTALRLAREAGIMDARLGPKTVSHLMETGLVLDGADTKVKRLDAALQKALRKQKIPFIRREVSVIRPDPGRVAWMSSSPPSSVVTEDEK